MDLCGGHSRTPGRQNVMGHQTTGAWWAQTLALPALDSTSLCRYGLQGPPTTPPTHVPALTYCSWGPDLSLRHSPPTAWILWLLPSSLLQERALLPASGLQDSNGGEPASCPDTLDNRYQHLGPSKPCNLCKTQSPCTQCGRDRPGLSYLRGCFENHVGGLVWKPLIRHRAR